ncbi:MAG: glucoamylase family protein [Kiritimatiellae bacterium]|nr:glucoamylase family protein [Kiritimatiellia bacterium]
MNKFLQSLAIALALALAALAPGCVGVDADQAFLDDLQRRSFDFFWETANPTNGLIPDRAQADGSGRDWRASIASVGFGLSALPIGVARGWVAREAARERAAITLRTFLNTVEGTNGFYYHFVDMATGRRAENCELSSIDTGLFLTGVLTVRQAFPESAEIGELAQRLYDRAVWPWMLNGGRTLSMGWFPERGFLEARWDGYSEHMILTLLGLGSKTHPLPPDSWNLWQREPVGTYAGLTFLQCPPLFTHQFSHAWVDFRDKRDAFADYWLNSVLATRAQRLMCVSMADRYPHYGDDLWGLTASDGPGGYYAWGGPPFTSNQPVNGVVVPCAPAGSVPFEPDACLRALRAMRERHGDLVWKRYGFADAFNPQSGWVAESVLGIDVGITLLMAENYRTGRVWNWFMANPEIRRAMDLAGFVSTARQLTADDKIYLEELVRDTWRCLDGLVHPRTGLPYDGSSKGKFTSVSNIGLLLTDLAAAKAMGCLAADEAQRRADAALDSLERLKTRFGFQQSWNDVETLAPATHDPWISVLDSGNLAAGLITAGQAFPELGDRCRALVNAMEWHTFLDPQRQHMLGGYHCVSNIFNPKWTMPFVGSDARMALFLAVASGDVPTNVWRNLDRGTEERYGARYYVPGWQGGGLFMQTLAGLWLDETGTPPGRSAANFVYAQIRHADVKGYPVWGWSACADPAGGYLGWGHLRDPVVTPHAAAMAVQYFPGRALANLRALEAMGARHASLGFYDAMNFETRRHTDGFLFLDQSMLFVSLVNVLRDGAVRQWFEADPLVRRGRELLDDYRRPGENEATSLMVP